MIPAVILASLAAFAVGAVYLWIADRDEKRGGYLPKSEPPSNCRIVVGPWPPRSVPEDES